MSNKILLCLFIAFTFSIEIDKKSLLFCLNKNEPLLELDSDGFLKRGNFSELDSILDLFSDSYFVEPWLSAASADDYSGDIYLNRIYRISFNNTLNRQSLSSLKEEILQLTSIYHVEDSYIRRPYYDPNDVRYQSNQQWFLTQVQADHAWDFWDVPNNQPGSKDILLASVDTGVDWNHTDLVNNIWQNLGEDADGDGRTLEYINGEWVFDPDDLNGIDDDNWDQNPNTFIDDLIGWDPSGISGENDNDPRPKPGVGNGSTWAHGTHVAGLLAATTDNALGIASVAFNSSIMSVKVSRENQQGDPYITDGYDGILYAAKAGHYGSDRGFAIINNSWGGGGYSQFEQATIDVCHDTYNAVIVAASGNGATDGGWGEAEEAHYPSSYAHVISVTALGTNDRWNHWATYHETVDLGSPGENIMSTKIQSGTETYAYTSWDGTSMASPVAASCIGLLSAFNPNWGNEQLETMIVATADPRTYTVNTEGYLQGKLGSGRVDAYRSLSTPLFPKIEIAAIDYQIIGGNSDNVIDAGESLHLSTILLNDSDWGEATNPSITLNSLSPYITITNPSQSISNIPSGDAYLNDASPFEVIISSNTPIGEYELELSFSSNDISYTGSSFNSIYEVTDTLSISVNNILFSDIFIPEEFEILNPFPNPFNPATTLSWNMNESGNFKIEVYDLKGSKLETLVNSYYTPGFYQYKWHPTNFSNGIYFIRYSLDTKHIIQKLTLIK